MGQACIKGPKSAGKQPQTSGKSCELHQSSPPEQADSRVPEGPDSTSLPEAKDSYDSADIQAQAHSSRARDSLDPINITANGIAHPPAAVVSTSLPSNAAAHPEPPVSEADSECSNSDVELLRNYAQLAEMLHFSPYPLMLIDIELFAQPIVFVSQVTGLCRSTITISVAVAAAAMLGPPLVPRVFCLIAGSAENFEAF